MGLSAIIFTAVFTAIFANAFPEKTFFLTINPFEVSGNATAPDTRPAFSLADRRGASAFPFTLFENTSTVAPVAVATCAIALT